MTFFTQVLKDRLEEAEGQESQKPVSKYAAKWESKKDIRERGETCHTDVLGVRSVRVAVVLSPQEMYGTHFKGKTGGMRFCYMWSRRSSLSWRSWSLWSVGTHHPGTQNKGSIQVVPWERGGGPIDLCRKLKCSTPKRSCGNGRVEGP